MHFLEKVDFFQEALSHSKLQIPLDSQELKAQIVAYLEISQLAFLQLNQLSQNTAAGSCASCQPYLTFCLSIDRTGQGFINILHLQYRP